MTTSACTSCRRRRTSRQGDSALRQGIKTLGIVYSSSLMASKSMTIPRAIMSVTKTKTRITTCKTTSPSSNMRGKVASENCERTELICNRPTSCSYDSLRLKGRRNIIRVSGNLNSFWRRSCVLKMKKILETLATLGILETHAILEVKGSTRSGSKTKMSIMT